MHVRQIYAVVLVSALLLVEMTPDKTGEIAFACGMNMLHGTLVVQ